jgi:hypothetical protein
MEHRFSRPIVTEIRDPRRYPAERAGLAGVAAGAWPHRRGGTAPAVVRPELTKGDRR